MKMTDNVEAGADEMLTQPKKKLKQARLPFQILSPAEKLVEVKPLKRKASSDDDLQNIKVGLDVKENHGIIPDKKLKIDLKEDVRVHKEKQGISKGKNLDKRNSKNKIIEVIVIDDDSVDKEEKVKISEQNIKDGTFSKEENTKILSDEVFDISVSSTDAETDKQKNCKTYIKNSTLLDNEKNISEESKKTDVVLLKQDTTVKVINNKEFKSHCNIKKEEKIELNTDVKKTEYIQEVNEKEKSDLNLNKTSQNDLSVLAGSVTESQCDSSESKDNSFSSTTSATDPISPVYSGIGMPKSQKLTPKQLSLRKKWESIREEKKSLKEEKRRRIAEKREEKERLRSKKEEERRKEKEEKEKKRLAEIEVKNEEKRLKEEERKKKEEAKEEEKKKKEEERKAKDEAIKQKEEKKRLQKEAKNAEQRKSSAAFVNFFVSKKLDSKCQAAEERETVEALLEVEKFMPFEVKGDMRLAPLVRKDLIRENKEKLDDALKNQTDACDSLYIQVLKSGTYVPSRSGKTWSSVVEDDDDVIIVEAENPEESSHVVSEVKEEKKVCRRHRAKLIQFHENRRPPYWGTWRKKSREIKPRAPFNMDKIMLEYEVDSDDEWEEIEDGESLRGSDDEESQDENYEEDNEMFVPHGYLSDEEGQDELEDTSPEAQKAKLKLLQLEFEAERSEKQERQKPRLIGCVWFRNTDDSPEKVGSQIAELFLPRRAVWDGDLPISLNLETVYKEESPSSESALFIRKKIVPESVIPKMISLIHGNQHRVSFLTKELYKCFIQDKVLPLPSCTSIMTKIKELASWIKWPAEEGPGKGCCWYVTADIRELYGLKDLKVTESKSWNYIQKPLYNRANHCEPVVQATQSLSSITKFAKVLSTEERQQQLLSNAKDSASPATARPANKPVLNNKKRVPLISVLPGQELPKWNNNLLDKFLITNSEAKCQSDKEEQAGSVQTTKQTPKRITPIHITQKETPTKSDNDCIIISD